MPSTCRKFGGQAALDSDPGTTQGPCRPCSLHPEGCPSPAPHWSLPQPLADGPGLLSTFWQPWVCPRQSMGPQGLRGHRSPPLGLCLRDRCSPGQNHRLWKAPQALKMRLWGGVCSPFPHRHSCSVGAVLALRATPEAGCPSMSESLPDLRTQPRLGRCGSECSGHPGGRGGGRSDGPRSWSRILSGQA